MHLLHWCALCDIAVTAPCRALLHGEVEQTRSAMRRRRYTTWSGRWPP